MDTSDSSSCLSIFTPIVFPNRFEGRPGMARNGCGIYGLSSKRDVSKSWPGLDWRSLASRFSRKNFEDVALLYVVFDEVRLDWLSSA